MSFDKIQILNAYLTTTCAYISLLFLNFKILSYSLFTYIILYVCLCFMCYFFYIYSVIPISHLFYLLCHVIQIVNFLK